MKKLKILLTGGSYSEHKGSAALLEASITNLKKRFPEVSFYFCSFTPENDKKTVNISNVYVIPYSFKVRSFEFLVSSIYLTLIRKGKNRIPIMNCLENADIIVDISGDTFSSEYGIVSILSLGARIFSAKVLKKPVVLYCQSIGPFEGFVDRSLAVLFLKLADLTIAREYVTAKYLRSLGIKTPVCADQAFLLEPTWNKAPRSGLDNINRQVCIPITIMYFFLILNGKDSALRCS